MSAKLPPKPADLPEITGFEYGDILWIVKFAPHNLSRIQPRFEFKRASGHLLVSLNSQGIVAIPDPRAWNLSVQYKALRRWVVSINGRAPDGGRISEDIGRFSNVAKNKKLQSFANRVNRRRARIIANPPRPL